LVERVFFNRAKKPRLGVSETLGDALTNKDSPRA
jgi:hypothetical protein